MSDGRTQKSLRNVIYGVLGQVLTYGCNFITRTVLIHTLSVEYWGVNGLFSTVLTLLSLSELGVGTAIVFHLYKPIAQEDIPKICSLMALYKRAYRYVGIFIAVIGVLLVPFLPYLIKGQSGIEHLEFIYLLFLLQSVTSYLFFAYKSAILEANQQKYIIASVGFVFTIVSSVGQILFLILTRNYIATLAIQIAVTILRNIVVAKKADQMYPYLKNKTAEKLPKDELEQIGKNVYGLSMNKIAGVALNSTANLILSTFIGLSVVGICSNYQMVFQAVLMIVSTVFSSLTASIGNLNATENSETKYNIFKKISFANYIFYGVISVVLWNVLNPFMLLWTKKAEFVFSFPIVAVLILNFLTAGLLSAVTSFRDACGLYWQGRYRMLIYAGINVGLSIILAIYLGVIGVFIAPVVGRLLIIYTFDPWLVYRSVFQKSPKPFYMMFILYLAIILIAAYTAGWFCSWVPSNSLFWIIVQSLICITVFAAITILVFFRTEEFQYYLCFSKTLFDKIKMSIGKKVKK